MRAIGSRTSELSRGRPPPPRDRHRRSRRQPARCHRITVSGPTTTRCRRPSRRRRRTGTQSSLPGRRKRTRGRRRVGRVSTASWCRSRFSTIRSPRRRQAAPTAARSRANSSSAAPSWARHPHGPSVHEAARQPFCRLTSGRAGRRPVAAEGAGSLPEARAGRGAAGAGCRAEATARRARPEPAAPAPGRAGGRTACLLQLAHRAHQGTAGSRRTPPRVPAGRLRAA